MRHINQHESPLVEDDIDFNILDILIDVHESFVSMLKELNEERGFSEISVDELSHRIIDLKQNGLIEVKKYTDKQFLTVTTLSKEQLAREYTEIRNKDLPYYDEVGYYFFLTMRGRQAWETYLNNKDQEYSKETWNIHEDLINKQVRIAAKKKTTAITKYEEWKKQNEGKKIKKPICIKKGPYKPKYYMEEVSGYIIEFEYK